MAGCLLALYWLDACSSAKISPRPLLRRICLACVAAMILSQLVRPWFAAASMSGTGGFAGNLALIPDILSSTHQGKLWYITCVALVMLVVATLAAGRRNRPILGWLFLASLLLIACTKAASGHAANEGDFTVAEFFMLLHILGIAVWAGAIVASGLLVLPHLAQFSDPTALWSYGKLLSRTVTLALAAILVSGIYSSDRELNGAWSGLWRSDWGRILMTKIALVSLALALGACTRFQCVQRPATSRTTALMVRLVRAEAVVMILILSLSGVLANTPPAMAEQSDRAVESRRAAFIVEPAYEHGVARQATSRDCCSSSARFQLLSNDASQRLLEPRYLSVEILPQRPIDKRLIPGRTTGFLRHPKEAIHNILVEPNCDSGLSRGLTFGWKHPAPFPFAEIISILHRSASYSSRSGFSAGRAEIIRMFSPRQVATTSKRPAAPIPSVMNRCSVGSDSSSTIVMA